MEIVPCVNILYNFYQYLTMKNHKSPIAKSYHFQICNNGCIRRLPAKEACKIAVINARSGYWNYLFPVKMKSVYPTAHLQRIIGDPCADPENFSKEGGQRDTFVYQVGPRPISGNFTVPFRSAQGIRIFISINTFKVRLVYKWLLLYI